MEFYGVSATNGQESAPDSGASERSPHGRCFKRFKKFDPENQELNRVFAWRAPHWISRNLQMIFKQQNPVLWQGASSRISNESS